MLLPDAPGAYARYHLDRRLAPGTTQMPMDALARAQQQMAQMPMHSLRSGGMIDRQTQAKTIARWQWLGPDNIAGRMRTLVFDPRNPDRMLGGGVSGGIFETTDGGNNWQPLTDDAANINIGALAVDPVAPDTIYAGTGELYRNSAQPYAAMWGQGVLRSLDNGRSFQQLPATANDDFRYVADIEISGIDHRRLYVASNSGVWRSDDGGDSFVRVMRPLNANSDPTYEGCSDLQLLPDSQRDVLLASCASRSTDDRYWLPGTILPPACNGPCPAAVFRNDDAAGSGTWANVLSEAGMGRTSIDYSRSNPSIVYAVSASILRGPDRTGDGIGDYDNGLHAVWRSTDGGRSWQARVRNTSSDTLSTYLLSYAHLFDSARCNFGAPSPYSAGWYNQAIAVDPINPEVVWVAGMELYRSDNGGTTFGKASYWWDHGVSPYGVHADVHLLRFHPQYNGDSNRMLFVANDGGLAVTDDALGFTIRGPSTACFAVEGMVGWRDLTRGMGTTQYYTGTVSADGTTYIGGLQDNGTLLNTSNGSSRSWRHVWGGDGASVALDPRNSNVIYASSQNVGLVRSDNGGASFSNARNGLSDTPIFIMPYILDQSAPDRLWAGATRIWRTDDQGRGWRAVSQRFGNEFYDRVSAIAQSPTDPNRMLAGTQRAILNTRSALTGTPSSTWNQVSPRGGWVSSLNFDPIDPDVAYATYSSFGGAHVWRTTDGGTTWTAIDGEGSARLPDIPVHSLAIDPGNRQRLFIGTDLGVFVSTDRGRSWAVENTGFANVITEVVAVARGNASTPAQLYAFTYGRGAWRVPLGDLDGISGYRIGADTSGTFFNPEQSGHGFVLQVAPIGGSNTVVVSWFTYANGEPRWLYGVGDINGDRVRITLSSTRGGQFPPAFDPAQVQIEPWGDLELRFLDANQAIASWTTTQAGFANGTLSIQRLTQPSAASAELPLARIVPCHAGTWFDATRSGHGLFIEVLGTTQARTLTVVWYVYADGKPLWLFGSGSVNGDRADLSLFSTRGANAPPNFNPASVVVENWGTASFRALNAQQAQWNWTSGRPGFAPGALSLTRLTGVFGHSCAGTAP